MIMKSGLIAISVAAVAVAFGITFAQKSLGTAKPKQEIQHMPMEGTDTLVVAGGCFWCVEAIYEELRGVVKVESGYSGGHMPNPNYEQVCMGITGHAEAVKITFEPKVISEDDLLHIFFTTHDPTTLNRQGPDEGTQYRSTVFFKNDEEKALATKVIKEVEREKIWPNPVVTTLEPLKEFYPAEDYHQDYFNKFEQSSEFQKMSMNSGYCRAIIEPKVRKFRAKYADKLKK